MLIETILLDSQNVDMADLRSYMASRDVVNPIGDSGAMGDGVTDTKTIIDTLNVAGTVVNLGGKDHAYTGTFVPVAQFINGRIISSVGGTFNYRASEIVGDITVTVGASGTFKRLKAALDWALSIRVLGTLTISITEHNDVFTTSGKMALETYTFNHPDAKNVFIAGPTLPGTFPAISDMVGTQATDEATAKARFGASIYLSGVTGNSPGLVLPNGIGGIDRLYIKSAARYSIDCGFNGSHSNSSAGRGGTIGNVCVSGGTWGLITYGAFWSTTGPTMWMYQGNGGPLGLNFSKFDSQNYDLSFYTSVETQYGAFLEAGSHLEVDNHLRVKGPFVSALKLKQGSVAICSVATFTNGMQAITAESGSRVKVQSSTITGADTTAITLTNTQEAFSGNDSSQNLVFAGEGAIVDVNALAITNCKARNGLGAFLGTITAYTPVVMTTCNFPAVLNGAAAYVYGSTQCMFGVQIVTPVGGSNDNLSAIAGSTVRKFSTSSGITNNADSSSTIITI